MTMCEFISFSLPCATHGFSIDSHPDRRSLLVDRKSRLKALGDKSRVPGLQNMGMYVCVSPSESTGPDVFVRLAKGYVVPEKPTKKKEVCALNAEVSARCCGISDSLPSTKGNLHYALLGCYTSWKHTRCSSVDLVGITFNGHRPRVGYRFVTSLGQGEPTVFAHSLNFSTSCSPFD